MRYTVADQQISNIQIIEKILDDIYSRKMPIKTKAANTDEQEYFCKLGAHVACYGTWSSANNQIDYAKDKYANERIKILAYGQIIANVNVKHTIKAGDGKHKPMPMTIIQVFSPNCGDNGNLSRETEGMKQLQVFHAKNENIDSVINQLKDQIAYSKAEKAYIDKFGSMQSIAAKLGNLGLEKKADDFDTVFSETDGIPLPTVETKPEELYHCNLKKPEWNYHTKLITPINDLKFKGMKSRLPDHEK